MEITIDISPEEVIELTKGNTEILNDMTTQITKLFSKHFFDALLNSNPYIRFDQQKNSTD